MRSDEKCKKKSFFHLYNEDKVWYNKYESNERNDPMKIVIAIDSFKGSLSSARAAAAVKEGVLAACPTAELVTSPLADGGEGTAEAVTTALGGERVSLTVTGPLGTPVTASYGFIRESKTAVMEMAAAAGITLIKQEERDPRRATTYGVGEMIRHAAEMGARRFIIGIGGSATNDGGVGMLSALGFSFLDKDGAPIPNGAAGLTALHTIRAEGAEAALAECEFLVACDVTNPLCGPTGCSAVYGPQKGVTPDEVPLMDKWLAAYAEKTKATLPHADPDFPGSGAAGGLGFALRTYLGATLQSGVSLVLDATRLAEKIKEADLVITGEGRLDGQTVMGKAPIGVAKLAKEFCKPVVAFSGCVGEGAALCNQHGIDAFFPILQSPCTLAEALNEENAYHNLKATATQAVRLFLIKHA